MKEKLKRAFNALHIADIHFGKKNDQKLYNDLKNNFLDNIPKIIKEYDHLDLVCIEGDLFDRVIKMTEISSNYVLKFITELCELSVKYNFYVRLIQGTKSHDNNQLNNFNHFEVKYPLFKMFKTVNSEVLSIGDYEYTILYLPEEYPENYKKYYKLYFNNEEYYDMILGHGMIDFVAFTGSDELKSKIKRNEAVHSINTILHYCEYFCIFGHIHDFQNYKDMDKVMYTGSFERFSFEDQKPKGYLMTRIDPETSITEAIFYENENASVYNIINLSEYNFESTEEKVAFIESEKKKCDYLKVIIEKDDSNKGLLKGVLPSDIKIESKNKLPEEVVDERFKFLIKKELPFDQSIAKYISITANETVELKSINKLLSKAESL